MTAAFWAAALAIVGIAWSVLWAGQRRAAGRLEAAPGNAALIDEEFAALDAERASGALAPDRYHDAVTRLQRRLLAEAGNEAASAASAPASPRTLAGLGIALPVFVLGAYLALGNPAALHVAPVAPAADEVSQADIERMVDTLAQRLRSRPAGNVEDLSGWIMLARSQAALRRFDDAAAAYERAVALAPDDAQLLADLADVLTARRSSGAPPATGVSASQPGDRAADEPERLVARALALDPQNPKALALAGTAAFDRGDVATARQRWQAARALAPPGSEFANMLDRSLGEVGGSGGAAVAPAGNNGSAGVAAAGNNNSSTAVAPAGIRGRVELAPALAGKAAPTDTVFVVARPAEGARMPLAVVRRTVADLPFDFELDDTLAMQPALKLSAHDRVVVSVRVSPTGEAMPRSGDLQGQSDTVSNHTAGLRLSIDTVRP